MNLATKLVLVAALVLSIFIPFGYYLIGERNKGRYKTALGVNVFFYFGTFLVAAIMLFGGVSVHAADGAGSGSSCIGGGIAVASAASAALGAISEDSSVLGKSLIFVGLAEGVCLYGLIISFMILSKLG